MDTFIEDLKDCVREAKGQPAGDGAMVAIYGTFSSGFYLFFEIGFLFSVSLLVTMGGVCVSGLDWCYQVTSYPYIIHLSVARLLSFELVSLSVVIFQERVVFGLHSLNSFTVFFPSSRSSSLSDNQVFCRNPVPKLILRFL